MFQDILENVIETITMEIESRMDWFCSCLINQEWSKWYRFESDRRRRYPWLWRQRRSRNGSWSCGAACVRAGGGDAAGRSCCNVPQRWGCATRRYARPGFLPMGCTSSICPRWSWSTSLMLPTSEARPPTPIPSIPQSYSKRPLCPTYSP